MYASIHNDKVAFIGGFHRSDTGRAIAAYALSVPRQYVCATTAPFQHFTEKQLVEAEFTPISYGRRTVGAGWVQLWMFKNDRDQLVEWQPEGLVGKGNTFCCGLDNSRRFFRKTYIHRTPHTGYKTLALYPNGPRIFGFKGHHPPNPPHCE